MIGIILAILGVMLILWWIWDSYRAAKAERFVCVRTHRIAQTDVLFWRE
jgi:uncharacterized membrane protein YqjE